MKKLLLLLAFISLSMGSMAQNIVGKWKCPKEHLSNLGVAYSHVKGYYKFMEDSTFKVKIKCRDMEGPFQNYKYYSNRSIRIDVVGKYHIANNTITTIVDPKDIECTVDLGEDNPVFPDPDAKEQNFLMQLYDENEYRGYENQAKAQEKIIKEEILHVWEWKEEPLTINKKNLIIGSKGTFQKAKRIF